MRGRAPVPMATPTMELPDFEPARLSMATPTMELPDFVPGFAAETCDTLPELPELEEWVEEEGPCQKASTPEVAPSATGSSPSPPASSSASSKSATSSSLETLPELTEYVPGACRDTFRTAAQMKGYFVGKPVQIWNDRAGCEVDAVVVDSHGDRVKLFYMVGGRCYTAVRPSSVLNNGSSTCKNMEPGAPVQVRSMTAMTWFKGTVLWSDGGFVKVHFRHNGRSCTKIMPKTSPDLRVLAGRPLTEAERCAALAGLH